MIITTRERVADLYEELLRANAAAIKADGAVVRRRTSLNRYCDENNYSEGTRREKFKVDYDLIDALDEYRRCLGEVQRISATLVGLVAAFAFFEDLTK